jgi:hypothetical protein
VDTIASTQLATDVLNMPFDSSRDIVLRGTVWREVRHEMPDWTQLCRLSFDVARRHLQSTPTLTELPILAARRAEHEVRTRVGILNARSRRLPTEAERNGAAHDMRGEKDLGDALIKGVAEPAISVIACGAVVLWPQHGR